MNNERNRRHFGPRYAKRQFWVRSSSLEKTTESTHNSRSEFHTVINNKPGPVQVGAISKAQK